MVNDDDMVTAVRDFLGLGDDVHVIIDDNLPDGVSLIAGDFASLAWSE
jgi:hypothetical protein